MTHDNTVDCYPGKVQLFFTHEVNLDGNLVKHHLAYIRWYKHTTRNRYHFSIDDAKQTCNTESNSIPLAEIVLFPFIIFYVALYPSNINFQNDEMQKCI